MDSDSASKCAFCGSPENKERTIVRNELVWAFPTNIPIVPGHILIAPVRCIATFDELTPEERTAIFALMQRMMRALEKSFGAQGFNVAWNQGEAAGQTVMHFHVHLLPRKDGDTGVLEYDPRKFLYRTGTRETSPQSELVDVAETIRKTLDE